MEPSRLKMAKSLKHKRSRSSISRFVTGSPAFSSHQPPKSKLNQPKQSERKERDAVEEFFDNLIKKREALHNSEDISKLMVSRKAKLKSETLADISPKRKDLHKTKVNSPAPNGQQATVISKFEVNYSPLLRTEGEDRLKKKINFFRNEIQRLLHSVEEYVVAVE
jgi:hypothetical protein